VEAITRAPSGKADYRWAAQTAAEALRRRPDAGS
jgi:hypothetical protein